jgi:hypothetical protein
MLSVYRVFGEVVFRLEDGGGGERGKLKADRA